VEYLGKQVVCQHCGARFEAAEPGSADLAASQSSNALLERAEFLLQSSGASEFSERTIASDVVPTRPR
jgi:hypothetical protein